LNTIDDLAGAIQPISSSQPDWRQWQARQFTLRVVVLRLWVG
jgi:hypothetical protein